MKLNQVQSQAIDRVANFSGRCVDENSHFDDSLWQRCDNRFCVNLVDISRAASKKIEAHGVRAGLGGRSRVESVGDPADFNSKHVDSPRVEMSVALLIL